MQNWQIELAQNELKDLQRVKLEIP